MRLGKVNKRNFFLQIMKIKVRGINILLFSGIFLIVLSLLFVFVQNNREDTTQTIQENVALESQISFSIDSASTNGNIIELNLKNTGEGTIDEFLIKFYGPQGVEQIREEIDLKVAEQRNFVIYSTFLDQIDKVEITPGISFDDKTEYLITKQQDHVFESYNEVEEPVLLENEECSANHHCNDDNRDTIDLCEDFNCIYIFPECNDSTDNDDDGFIDLADQGCSSRRDNNEGNTICSPSDPNCQNIEEECGDGIVSGTEQCDEGVANGLICAPSYGGVCSYCSSECSRLTLTGHYCQDGIVQPNEQCDDGNNLPGDGCYNCIIEDILQSGFLPAELRFSKEVRSTNHPEIPLLNNIADFFIPMEITLLRDEGESFQFGITDSSEHDYSLTYQILKNNQQSTDLDIELYTVDYAYVNRVYYNLPGDTSPVGYYSDPLVSYEPGDITRTQSKIWWVTIRSKKNTPIGTYTLLLKVKQDGIISQKSANIVVLKPYLPEKSTFRMVLNEKFQTDAPDGYTPMDYHAAATSQQKKEVVKNYMKYLDKNRISHARPYYDPSCSLCGYIYKGASPNLNVLSLSGDDMVIDFTSFDELMVEYIGQGKMNSFIIGGSSWGFHDLVLQNV